MHELPNVHTTPDSRALAHVLACYHKPNCARGVLELGITGIPLVLIWTLM
jgi:acyl-lipid omega-6 desaturase (Delta-12 desaturase)